MGGFRTVTWRAQLGSLRLPLASTATSRYQYFRPTSTKVSSKRFFPAGSGSPMTRPGSSSATERTTRKALMSPSGGVALKLMTTLPSLPLMSMMRGGFGETVSRSKAFTSRLGLLSWLSKATAVTR